MSAGVAPTFHMKQGEADPALTYQTRGSLVGSDAFSGSLTRAAGEALTSYPILQGNTRAECQLHADICWR